MMMAILGTVSILRMPTDIFPEIDIPWSRSFSPTTASRPEDMERRIVTTFERVASTTVNDIERIESQSLNGVAVVKIYFQPTAKIEAATAQVHLGGPDRDSHHASGTQPPLIIRLQRQQRADSATRAEQ